MLAPLALGFTAANLWLHTQAHLPPVGYSGLLVAGLALVPVAIVVHRPGRRALLSLIAGLLLGLALAGLHGSAGLQHRLSTSLEGQDLALTGRVVGLPESGPRGVRFVVVVQSLYLVADDGAQPPVDRPRPRRLRLTWYATPGQSPPDLRPGARLALVVRVKRAHGMANPGGFDREAWLFARRIDGVGYVRGRQAAPPEAGAAGCPGRCALDRVRAEIDTRIRAERPPTAGQGALIALTIGHRAWLDPQTWDVLVATGTNHLMAISGLHVSLIAAWALVLSNGLRWLPALTARVAAPRLGALLALVAATGYALLSGFNIPAQRALTMLAVALLALWWRRPLRPGAALALALVAVQGLDPLAALSPGFWLSFGAVAALVWVMYGRVAEGARWWAPRRLAGLVGLQIALLLALAPLTGWFFGQASLISPLANLVAVPLVGGVVVPLAVLGGLAIAVSEPLGAVLLVLPHALLDGVLAVLTMLAEPDWARVRLARPPVWALLCALAGAAAVLAPAALGLRLPGLVLMIPIVTATPERPAWGGFRYTQLDVGQGNAAVIETAHHTLVYDTGARFPSGFNAGEAAVVPFLISRGVRVVDRVIISHGDLDHIGGLAGIVTAMPVGEIVSDEPDAVGYAVGRGPEVTECIPGRAWHWDGVRFSLLHPDRGWSGSDNARSCVLRVEGRGGSLLLTGDLEAVAEVRLLRLNKAALDVDIIQVPHHGSRTSSLSAFVAAVSPRIAVVAMGYRNRFGLPDPERIARYRRAGARVVDTVSGGAITLRVTPTGVAPPTGHRIVSGRYFHLRPAGLPGAPKGWGGRTP